MLEFRLACTVGILRGTFSKQITELRKITLSLIPTPPPPMGSTVADTFTHVYTCVSTNFSVSFGPFWGLSRYYPQFLCHPIPRIIGNLLFFLNSVPTVLSTSNKKQWVTVLTWMGGLRWSSVRPAGCSCRYGSRWYRWVRAGRSRRPRWSGSCSRVTAG